ncbi:MAG: hypothetical protein ACLUOI_09700 [Eisenbergiella sp.]
MLRGILKAAGWDPESRAYLRDSAFEQLQGMKKCLCRRYWKNTTFDIREDASPLAPIRRRRF